MNNIKNYSVYNKRMNVGLYDKSWWVDKIDDDVTTIVDFGCGTGALFAFVDRMFPGRFTSYIGIDNDEKMRSAASEFYADDSRVRILENFENGIDYDHAVLVMNSVVHELYAYRKIYSFLLEPFLKKFHHIAIRDMYLESADIPNHPWIGEKLLSPYNREEWIEDEWNDYVEHHKDNYFGNWHLYDFLFSYSYRENWERERDEFYFWPWINEFWGCLDKTHYLDYEDDFYIPQQGNKIFRETGYVVSVNTHAKVLFTKRDE